MSFQLLHTQSATFHTCPFTLTQPPPDFQPPVNILNKPFNGWYHGKLREKQGVFSSQYVEFQYSRELISNSKNLPVCVPVMQYNQ